MRLSGRISPRKRVWLYVPVPLGKWVWLFSSWFSVGSFTHRFYALLIKCEQRLQKTIFSVGGEANLTLVWPVMHYARRLTVSLKWHQYSKQTCPLTNTNSLSHVFMIYITMESTEQAHYKTYLCLAQGSFHISTCTFSTDITNRKITTKTCMPFPNLKCFL